MEHLAAILLVALSLSPQPQSCGDPEAIQVDGRIVEVGQTVTVRIRQSGGAEDTVMWQGMRGAAGWSHFLAIEDGQQIYTTTVHTSNAGPLEFPATVFDSERWTWVRFRATHVGKTQIIATWLCMPHQHLLPIRVTVKPQATYLPLVAKPPAAFEVPLQ